jgi:hypothetical protein
MRRENNHLDITGELPMLPYPTLIYQQEILSAENDESGE